MSDTLIERLIFKLDAETNGFEDRIDDARTKVKELSSFLTRDPRIAAAALSAALLSVAVVATKMAAEVDQAMRKLRATLPTGTQGLGKLREELAAITKESPRTEAELLTLANAVAKMGETDPAQIAANVRTLALVGDAIGATDLTELADQLDLIGDAFGLTADQARRTFVQIAAMAKGKIDLGDLAATFSKTATQLNAMGVSAENAAAAMTLLIDKGVDRRKITAGLVDLLDRAGQAEDKALDAEATKKEGTAKALRIVGQTLSDTNVRSKGLVGALAELYEKLGRSKAQFLQAGLSVAQFAMAQAAAQAQAEGNAKQSLTYAEALHKMSDAALINRNSAQALAQILKNELSATLVDLGTTILPPVIKVMQGLALMFSSTRREAAYMKKDIAEAGREFAALAAKQKQSGPLQFAPGVAIRTIDNTAAGLVKKPSLVMGMDERELKQLLANIQDAIELLDGKGLNADRMKTASAAVQLITQRLRELAPAATAAGNAAGTADPKLTDTGTAAFEAAAKVEALRDKARDLYQSLTGTNIDREIAAITDLGDEMRKAGVDAREIDTTLDQLKARVSERAAADLAKQMTEFTASLEANYAARNDLTTSILEEDRARKAAKTSLDLQLRTLADEAQRLATGSQARNLVIEQLERQQAIEEAMAKERARNGSSETSINIAGSDAARLYDARRNVEIIRKAMQELSENDVAARLSGVAAAFTQVAQAMGKSGEGLGRVMGVLGPMLAGVSSLSQALIRVKTDGRGNPVMEGGKAVTESVGFFSSISGKAGAASQAKSIAGAASIMGAVALVADSLDLFGTKAKAKAEEMKQAAIRFNDALAEYVAAANPQGGASEAIRQQTKLLREQMRGLSEKFFGKENANIFDTMGIDQLKVMLDKWRELGTFFKLGTEAGDQLQTVIESYEKLVKAAKDQVLANLEDLGVRRLLAQGLSSEAAALRESIASHRELTAASRDTTTEGQAYYKALLDVAAAEAAAAEAERRRATRLRQLGNDDALLGDTAAQRLQRYIAASAEMFGPAIANALSGFDFSTADGLKQAKQKIRDLYAEIAKDGVTEAEQPIVDFLKTLFGQIGEAIDKLPDPTAALDAKLDWFREFSSTFQTDLATQINQLRVIFADQFGGVLNNVLGSVDLSNATGRAQFKNQIETLLAGILGDGKIDEAERPLYNALQMLLGIAIKAIDDATKTAEEIAANNEADRQAALSKRSRNATLDIALGDLEGVDAFRAKLGGYSEAFGKLFTMFDLGTLAGVNGAHGALLQIRADLDRMTDDEILAKFGMTRDELIAAILDVDAGLDTLGLGLKDLATKQADFLTQMNLAYFDAFGMGFETVKLQTELWVAEMKATAAKLFTGLKLDEVNKQIDAIGKQRITNWQRDQQQATSGASPGKNYTISSGVTLEDLAAMSPQERAAYYENQAVMAIQRTGAAGGQVQAMVLPEVQPTNSTTPRDTFVASDITRASETSVLTLTGIMTSGLIEWRRSADAAEGLLGLLSRVLAVGPLPTLTAPILPTSLADGGALGGGITLVININAPIDNPRAMGRQLADEMLPFLNASLARAAGVEARNVGRPTLS